MLAIQQTKVLEEMYGTITGRKKEVGVIDTLSTLAALTRSDPTERMLEDISFQFIHNFTSYCVCLCKQCQCIDGVGTEH